MGENVEQWLDPVEFPFSAGELRAALVSWPRVFPEDEDYAAELEQSISACREEREQALTALARGSTDPREVNFSYAHFPQEVFALMADLSEDHEVRVEHFLRSRIVALRPNRLRRAMRERGMDERDTPPTEIIALIDTEEMAEMEHWKSFRTQTRAVFSVDRG